MELKPDRFERQLAGEPLKPVYLIAGQEPLLVQELADAVRARAREQGYAEREILDADAAFDWNRLAQGLASLSLFATRRLFDLRLPSGKPGKEGAEALREYCDSPPPDTVLLITTQDWSRQHAGKWTEAIARAGHLTVAWPVKVHELGDWLQRRLRSRGLVATPDAVQRLADRVEGNLLAAAQEVDKLVLALGPAAGPRADAIDAATMERLVADSSRFDVFKLADAALAGEAVRATRMLAALRAEGEQVAGLMPVLVREVLLCAGLARAAAAGTPLMSAMREARIWDSRMATYKRAVERHPAGRWEAFATECGRIDRCAKGRGTGNPWVLLERLLVALAEPRARGLLAS